MRLACLHAPSMSKMVQIRNVPDRLHRTLKVRAAESNLSLSDYLLRILERDAHLPTLEEVRARLASRPSRVLSPTPTEILRAEREHS